MISDDSASPFDYTTQEFMRQDVRKILEKLKPKEREVLSLRFGLEDGQELSDAKPAFLTNTAIAISRSLAKARFNPGVHGCCQTTVCCLSYSLDQNQLEFEQKAIYFA